MTVDSSSHADPALVVLVHGAWHGAWCWATLQAELEGRGIPSFAVDLPGHGVSTSQLGGVLDDAAALVAVLDRLAAADSGPVVLIGHSYGGAVITQAAAGRDDVAHLVYVAAFALETGESVISALGSFERRDVDLAAAMVPTTDGTATTLDPQTAAGALYGDCPEPPARAALARLGPQTMLSMTQPVDANGRQEIESTYVVCTRDRAVHPDHQATMAERCRHRVGLDTDHSPFISAVEPLAAIIGEIATSS
ncbi:alpha/beta hydrolase [Ilumatobacter nonamiensis]|uniref:alpha/beta hydrolase n=1 Tax=Ilumatobacter nonamiensis TaxID=467093 RepID=UPI00034846F4|nr:alpha/beta hydrolase [Ilumatobacter nonamiensis]